MCNTNYSFVTSTLQIIIATVGFELDMARKEINKIQKQITEKKKVHVSNSSVLYMEADAFKLWLSGEGRR